MSPTNRVRSGIAYAPDTHPSLTLNLSVPLPLPSSAPPLIVFFHEGAWCTRPDESALAIFAHGVTVASNYTIAMATVLYRLTRADDPDDVRVQHPAQVEDAVRALLYLFTHAADYGYDAHKIVLMGHSAGACMIYQLCMDPSYIASVVGNDALLASRVRRAVIGCIGLSGIYSIPEMLEAHPTYTKFVYPVFGCDPAVLKAVSPAHLPVLENEKDMQHLIVHSSQDELLVASLSRSFIKRLKAGKAKKVKFEDNRPWGTHTGMIQCEQLWKATVDFVWDVSGVGKK